MRSHDINIGGKDNYRHMHTYCGKNLSCAENEDCPCTTPWCGNTSMCDCNGFGTLKVTLNAVVALPETINTYYIRNMLVTGNVAKRFMYDTMPGLNYCISSNRSPGVYSAETQAFKWGRPLIEINREGICFLYELNTSWLNYNHDRLFIWRRLLFGGGFYLEKAFIWRRLLFGGGFYSRKYDIQTWGYRMLCFYALINTANQVNHIQIGHCTDGEGFYLLCRITESW